MRASYGSSNYSKDRRAGADDAAKRHRPAGAGQDLRGARDHQRPGRQRHRRGGAELGREGAALRDQGPDAAGGDPARDAGADHRRARKARADRRLRRASVRSRSTLRRASAPPSSPRARAKSRPRSTRRRARPPPSARWPRPPRRPSSALLPPSASPGGEQAVQLKVAEKAVEAYARVAHDADTTLIVPSTMSEVSALIGSAMKMVGTVKSA